MKHTVVRHLIKNDVISLEYVKSEKNLADPFTKGLARKVVLDSSKGMGLSLELRKIWWIPACRSNETI